MRNTADLQTMACPVKYRALGHFHQYYAGAKKAPKLTIVIGGNHESSGYMWEWCAHVGRIVLRQKTGADLDGETATTAAGSLPTFTFSGSPVRSSSTAGCGSRARVGSGRAEIGRRVSRGAAFASGSLQKGCGGSQLIHLIDSQATLRISPLTIERSGPCTTSANTTSRAYSRCVPSSQPLVLSLVCHSDPRLITMQMFCCVRSSRTAANRLTSFSRTTGRSGSNSTAIRLRSCARSRSSETRCGHANSTVLPTLTFAPGTERKR